MKNKYAITNSESQINNKKDPENLKICLLTYRGNPTCGGQGVYIRHLSNALKDIGHEVDVISGPPYPELNDDIKLHCLPGLDLYNPKHQFKVERRLDLLHPINLFEYLGTYTKGFPEPLAFSLRAYRYLKNRLTEYDVIHDNQCISYGILGLKRLGFPIVTTIHHPIEVDKEVELQDADSLFEKFKVHRWYSFLGMQARVVKRLSHLITVSECSKSDLAEAFNIPESKFQVVPNGIDTNIFYPLSGVKRLQNNIMVTNSADSPLKGLKYLLEAVSSIKEKRSIKLTVIGSPKKGGMVEKIVSENGLSDIVRFTGRIENEEFAEYYAQATVAVVPSIYEGFGLPAGEAMASGVPVIGTTGGALPEVVGDAGILVPPGDSKALENAIISLLDDPEKRERLSKAGMERVHSQFSWRNAAEKTVEVYHEAIDANH